MEKVVNDPYINLAVSVLRQAKDDSNSGRQTLMWAECKRDYIKDAKRPAPMAVAQWVVGFMRRNGIAEHCLSVRDGDIRRQRKW